MSEHTKEPWRISQYGNVVAGDNNNFTNEVRVKGFTLSSGKTCEDNARRIVACVNACEGIPTEVLESGPHRIIQRYAAAERQRDELLAALKDLHKAYRMAVGLHSGQDDAYTVRSHNAIAKAEQS